MYSTEWFCTPPLLELFGLLAVEPDEPDEGQSWCVQEVRHTAFRDELLQITLSGHAAWGIALVDDEQAADLDVVKLFDCFQNATDLRNRVDLIPFDLKNLAYPAHFSFPPHRE